MVDELYWSSTLRVFGSFFVISIVLLYSSRDIRRDPCIEGIISTAEYVGGVGHILFSEDLDIHDIAYLSYSLFLIGELDTTST
jgi:hypothetical protein